jgi:hypothetical protein
VKNDLLVAIYCTLFIEYNHAMFVDQN